MAIYLTVLIIYMAIMVVLGLMGAKKCLDTEDFLIASGKMDLKFVTASLFANMISGFFIIGSVGMDYVSAWSDLALLTGPAGISYILLGILFAGKIKKVLQRTGRFTIPDMFALRYGRPAALLAAIMLIIVFLGFCGGQIEAIQSVFTTIFHLDSIAAVIIITACVIVYSIFGGMWSLAYTMIVQAVIIWIGMIIAAFVSMKAPGVDLGTMVAALGADHFKLSGYTTLSGGIAFGLSMGLATFPGQDMWQRAAAAKDIPTARKAFLIFGILAIGLGVVNFFIALPGAYMYPGLENPESLFAVMIGNLMSPWIGSIVVAALISAILSTAAACALVIGMLVVNDIYKPYIAPNKPDHHYLTANRIVLAIAGAVSMIFVAVFPSAISMLYMACNMQVTSLLFPVFAAFFSKKVTPLGGLLSIIIGGGSNLVWLALGVPGGFPDFYVGLIGAVVGMIIGTAIGKPATMEQLAPFHDDLYAEYEKTQKAVAQEA